jgi:hypothetical protein
MVTLAGLKSVALVYGPKAILWVQQNWGWLSTLGAAAFRELDKQFS